MDSKLKTRLRLAHQRRYSDPVYRIRIQSQNRDWAKENPESTRKRSLAWRNRNLDRARATTNLWHRGNRPKRRAYEQAKRAKKFGSSVNPKSISVFMDRVRATRVSVCYYCKRRVSSKAVHFDHIVPLSKGGPHSVENLCVSCPACNLSKSAKRLRDFVTLGQQILEL